MHVNTHLKHSMNITIPQKEENLHGLGFRFLRVCQSKTQPWYCGVRKKSSHKMPYFLSCWTTDQPKRFQLPSCCPRLPPGPAHLLLLESRFHVFICNSPETAGDSMIWSMSLSHFPQPSEIQVRRYAGHTGGNGADLIEWGGAHGSSDYIRQHHWKHGQCVCVCMCVSSTETRREREAKETNKEEVKWRLTFSVKLFCVLFTFIAISITAT